MQLDPVLELSLRSAFLALFAGSLIHKVVRLAQFKATVASYVRNSALARDGVVLALTIAVIVSEALVVIVCIAPVGGVERAMLVAAVLVIYAGAMAVNLLRGNSRLDCGCSWGSARQPVGYELVGRNLVLALAALLLMLPVGAREMSVLDVVSVLAGTLTAALMYAAVNRLFTSAALISGRG